MVNKSGGSKEYFFGNEAINKNKGGVGLLRSLRSPINYNQFGSIEDWVDMERLWQYTFEKTLGNSIDL